MNLLSTKSFKAIFFYNKCLFFLLKMAVGKSQMLLNLTYFVNNLKCKRVFHMSKREKKDKTLGCG